MLIDTHCHLDAPEFDADRDDVIAQAQAAGVQSIVLPAVAPFNFGAVRTLAHALPGGAYALGIHPMYVERLDDLDMALAQLSEAVTQALADPRFVAIGEIGLDGFIPGWQDHAQRERQVEVFHAQLRLAVRHDLPVLLHVRKAQDSVLAGLRRFAVRGGIAHAFNGSQQQADAFIRAGCALGVGGAMTFERANNIRRIVSRASLAHLVLETDAPDIPPAWLMDATRRNTPAELPAIAACLAELRGETPEAVIAATGVTARQHLPRLDACLLAA